MGKINILAVEDDKTVLDGLCDLFASFGYRAFPAENIADALKIAEAERLDLAVLDVSLGADSGFDLCRALRAVSDMPILFLTARSSEAEVVCGFSLGADDYLTKPFRASELMMRIRALLKRSRKSGELISSGELTVDFEKQTIRKFGIAVPLSSVEWKIAYALINAFPEPLTREELYFRVWGKASSYVGENALNVNISRLREKLGDFNGKTYIETVRGVGYRWTEKTE